MKFKMILETMPGEPRWESDFNTGSVDMAVEYTKRQMVASSVIAAARCNVSLFNMDANGAFVGVYKLAVPSVVCIEQAAT